MMDKYIYKILGFFDTWSEKLDKVFFHQKEKKKEVQRLSLQMPL